MRNRIISVAKTKALICAFVFGKATILFSHDAPHSTALYYPCSEHKGAAKLIYAFFFFFFFFFF